MTFQGPIEADPLIELRGVRKSYRRKSYEVQIFEKLDLEFARGEFAALMGPSGSGKTTLLNLLGGIDRVSGGEILFKGRPIQALGETALAGWRARHVGLIFQFYNLMPGLTAAQNVELPLMLHKMSRRERKERVASVLDLVGLESRSKHLPSELSGGQQQRVAIARSIVADPELILADEPTGDLDRDTANEILELLSLLSSALGKTIVMVTHDQQAADAAGRLLRLDKGHFVASEPVQ